MNVLAEEIDFLKRNQNFNIQLILKVSSADKLILHYTVPVSLHS